MIDRPVVQIPLHYWCTPDKWIACTSVSRNSSMLLANQKQ